MSLQVSSHHYHRFYRKEVCQTLVEQLLGSGLFTASRTPFPIHFAIFV
jgi:hypothetical protein